jgi:prevent-host-death family protein
MESQHSRSENHFLLLLERVALGEEVIIAKAGKPGAKLVPLDDQPKRRVLGSAKPRVHGAGDFNDPLPKEIEALFCE